MYYHIENCDIEPQNKEKKIFHEKLNIYQFKNIRWNGWIYVAYYLKRYFFKRGFKEVLGQTMQIRLDCKKFTK